jgi:transposase, IS5 family
MPPPSMPASTKNRAKARDAAMHSTRKGNHWSFGMKAYIGADADSGLVHTVVATASNVADVTPTSELLHGQEKTVYADAELKALTERCERLKVQVRARGEHPVHILKNRFGDRKVRDKGLEKNTVQLYTLLALANPIIVKNALLAAKQREQTHPLRRMSPFNGKPRGD